MTIDPRDSGQPGIKEWEEFRASYSAAFVLVWLLDEARGELGDYVLDLHDRFMTGWDIQREMELDSELPVAERGFPLPPRGGRAAPNWTDDIVWMDDLEASVLYDQLFPHSDLPAELGNASASLAVVAFHSALEAYLKSLGIHWRGSMPKAVEKYVRGAQDSTLLDSDTMRWLTECDGTRNVVVHNRGIVDERYIRAPHGTLLQIGEWRSISRSDLQAFARTIWRTASLVRDVDAAGR